MGIKLTGSFKKQTGMTKFTDPNKPKVAPADRPPEPTSWDAAGMTGGYTLSNGNLSVEHPAEEKFGGGRSENGISVGKAYWEMTTDFDQPPGVPSAPFRQIVGILKSTVPVGDTSSYYWDNVDTIGMIAYGGFKFVGGSGTGVPYGSSWGAGDTVGVALDMDNGAIWMSINGVWQDTATLSEVESGDMSNAMATGLVGATWLPAFYDADSVYGWKTTANFGGDPFNYTVPAGFRAGLWTK